MSVVFFLIAIGVVVAGGFLVAFIWAVRSGQYDDDYAPSVRILFDDYKPNDNSENNKNQKSEKKEDQKKETDKSENN